MSTVNSPPLLESRDLTIGYKARRQPPKVIAADLNLKLAAGELVCLLGPNGAGKSTLLRTLAGMQPALSGDIWVKGTNLSTIDSRTLAQHLSVVLTEQVDVGLLTGYAMVALGRYPYTDWRGTLTAQDELIVQRSIQAVDGVALAGRPVSELSDGERQKMLIARALAQEPAVMILDEPTAFLDLPRRIDIMRILRQLSRRREQGFLLSTHDLDLALRTADKIWLMGEGEFHIGTPEDLVLDGAFARTFATEGVKFDPQNGSFLVNQPPGDRVAVVGDGVTAIWTIRALERAGYHVVDDPHDASLQIICSAGRWTINDNDTMTSCDSIDALLNVLS